MNKYWVQFSISAYTACYTIKADSRSEVLKKVKKRFNKEYKTEFRYPKFSIKKIK